MKKGLILTSSFLVTGMMFFGCAKPVNQKCGTDKCGTDKCGNKYIDRTYRQYVPLNNCGDICDNADILSVNTQCVNRCNLQKQAPKPKSVIKPKLKLPKSTPILKCNKPLRITVVGQGVAPCNGSCSPSQAYALAKRAAIADSYRLIAEKIKGVYVEGNDLIRNMMVKRSTVKTSVAACIKNANIVETTFKDGLCEVEMEITIFHSQFAK